MNEAGDIQEWDKFKSTDKVVPLTDEQAEMLIKIDKAERAAMFKQMSKLQFKQKSQY